MGTAEIQYTSAVYGALELKQYYQRSMGMGVLIAAAFHLTIVGGLLIYQSVESLKTEDSVPVIHIYEPLIIAPPPPMTAKPEKPGARPDITVHAIGIPRLMPDDEVAEDPQWITRDEFAVLITRDGTGFGSGGDSFVVDIPPGVYFPEPSDFIPIEEQPVLIKEAKPEYPEMARLTDTEGAVVVQAFVDNSGMVREVRILKSSSSNIGFDEAALEAAYKNIYKPAIQNGQPIGVWVAYTVRFSLR